MKVLIVTGIFPPDIGGPASYVPRMAGALVSRGHVVTVVTLADRITPAEADFVFPVHRITRETPRPLRVARTVSVISKLGRKADVIYANGLVLESVVASRLAARPLVVKVVGDLAWERARNAGRGESIDAFQSASLPLRWRSLRMLQGAYMRRARRIITPSVYLKQIVTGWGVAPERIEVIYNAVPQESSKSSAPATEFDLVSVGRLVPWKGFAVLIDLVAERGWSLKIVGDGPLRHDLEAHAKGVGAKVRFTGHLPQHEVADAIRSARVFVLNSSYEGLPHIVLEAMELGVPVVATAAGGTPETIVAGETGLLVPVGNAPALERAIASVLDDPSRAADLTIAAKQRLAERFSFKRMVEETERLLVATADRGKVAWPAP